MAQIYFYDYGSCVLGTSVGCRKCLAVIEARERKENFLTLGDTFSVKYFMKS